jgi:hypothetical protein
MVILDLASVLLALILDHFDKARLTSGVGTLSLDLPDEVLALGDLTEDDVLTVQPGGNDGGDEELGSVGVGSSVGHGEQEGLVVPQLEVLIGELVSVDGLSTGTVVVGELWVNKNTMVDRQGNVRHHPGA